jgi:hypothetical protein
MKKVIRYYFLEGRATFVNDPSDRDGKEIPLTIPEYHDFILNKKSKMTAIENQAAQYHRKFVDYQFYTQPSVIVP